MQFENGDDKDYGNDDFTSGRWSFGSYTDRLSEKDLTERKLRRVQKDLDDLQRWVRDKLRPEDRVYFDRDNVLCFEHLCLGDKVDTRLDGWNMAPSGHVRPSVRCQRCGAHFNIKVEMRLHYMEGYGGFFVRSSTPRLPRSRRKKETKSDHRNAESDNPEGDGHVQLERDPGGAGSGEEGVREPDDFRELPRFRGGRSGKAQPGS